MYCSLDFMEKKLILIIPRFIIAAVIIIVMIAVKNNIPINVLILIASSDLDVAANST